MRLLGKHDVAASYDAIVIGSGAGGLVAALTAAKAGKSVLVLEKSSQIGGTSAVSAGTIWIPGNDGMVDAALHDDMDSARQYLSETVGQSGVIEAFLASANAMIAFLRANSSIQLVTSLTYPDYKLGLPGSRSGRAMQPGLYDTKLLGEWRDVLRRDIHLPQYSMMEFKQWGAWANFPWDELRERTAQGVVARGAALVGPILQACFEAGVDVAIEARVDDLVERHGAVCGVSVGGRKIGARVGVVLACGGFEWNAEMIQQHLPAEITVRCSPPHNTGDGHRMAKRLNARFESMDQVWWAPMAAIPGQMIEEHQVGRHMRAERQAPGVIIVDSLGERFVNEAQDYNSLIRAAIAASRSKGAELRMYVVFDQRFLERYGFLTYDANSGLPDWIGKGRTLDEVARRLDIDPVKLVATVKRFNAFAEAGVDEDFHRGDSAYDKYGGDKTNPYPNSNLAPIEIAPFYGMEVLPGAFGTAGGVATNEAGRALREDGAAIPGLYAIGNVSAHPLANGYPGAGSTLGPAMTMGYVVGQDLANGVRAHADETGEMI